MTRAAGSVVLFVALLAAPARAQPAEPAAQASALAAEGAKLYTANDYLGAADHFDKAYALDPTPSYLFNAAQAYRLANVCDKSAARYEKFLDIARDAQNVDKVRKYLDDERACAKEQGLAPPPPPPPPPARTTQPIQPPLPPPPPPANRAWVRWTGLGTAVVGLGALGLGFYELGQVSNANRERDSCNRGMNPDGSGGPCDVSLANRIDRDGTSASRDMGIGFGVGAAAVAGGVVLYLLGRDPESASITPTAGGAMLSTRIRF